MKKRSRIEITTFRSRTTIIVGSRRDHVEQRLDPVTMALIPANAPPEEVDHNPFEVVQLSQSGLIPAKLKEGQPSKGEQR